VVFLAGCKSFREQENELPDTRYKGSINISVDESFKPVMDELVQVYESNYPGTQILVQYKPEAECLNDMLTDSIRMIISTRTYNLDERSLLIDSMKVSQRV
jgi:phosphate transport system substrate-binding protein